MDSQFFERHAQLAQWLYRLVEILRIQGNSTWRDLVRTVSGKTAAIALDGIVLQLRGEGGEQLQVTIEYPVTPNSVNFRCEAETLRDIIAGRLTLDAAIAANKIYLQGTLHEILGIHQIVIGILADSAINPELQHLWTEFDEFWSRPPSPLPCRPLEYQRPSFGELIRQVPEDVLNIQIQLGEEQSAD